MQPFTAFFIAAWVLLVFVACGDSGTSHASDPANAVDADASEVSDSGGQTEQDAAEPDMRCEPDAGGPYNLLEGETVSLTVVCTTGLHVPASLSMEPLPLGAKYDKKTATLTWTPTLDQAAVYEISVRASPSDEPSTLKIAVADRWDAMNNVRVVDPSKYTEEYGLPVIHLTTDPSINNDEYLPATIVYRGHTFEGAQAKTRGTVSASYPKRSYTLKLTKADKWNEPIFGAGFRDKRKVTLITSFDDNSYLRQRMGFELWNRLDPSHIQVKNYSAVLFLNGRYYGLYTVTDHVDGYLMEDHGLNQDGDLYKARNGDANFRVLKSSGAAKTSLHEGFTKEEGLPAAEEPGAFDALDGFLSWVQTSSAASFGSEIDTRMQRSDYEDWWIFVSFVMADDSTSKNSFHYRDPSLPGSLWRCVPWDFNHSFGQDWRTERTAPQLTKPAGIYISANGLFARMLADPTLGPALRTRYGTVLSGAYALDTLLAVFDGLIPEIDASARRDEQKWQPAYRAFGSWKERTNLTSYEEELQYMRQWIIDRHAYLETLY